MCVCVFVGIVCVWVCMCVFVYVCNSPSIWNSSPYQEAELCPVNNTLCGDHGKCSVQNNQRTCNCVAGTSIIE